MNWAKEFVELDKVKHDRASFDCGETEINTFLQTQAAKHMEVGISKTMLLPASEPLGNGKYPVCAFYTIVPGSIKRETLPDVLAKKLPHYPIPVFLLAQMAVHTEYQGVGLGKICLIKSLEYLWKINSYIHAYGVIVDCLNSRVEQFYLKYGFELLYTDNGKTRMFIPMKTVAQLFV